MTSETRTEKDPLGPLEVPADAYYGVQTQRAIRNFPISGRRPDIALVRAAVQVKKAAARANHETGRLPDDLAGAIIQAADEILGERDGGDPGLQAELIDNFRVDPFQAGAGVSHNMNTNEVLANRAIEILGGQGVGSGQRGDYSVVNPNDHVNMAQSTNDTFPTSMRVATLDKVRDFLPVLDELVATFARACAGIRPRAEERSHAHAGRRADPARPGVRGLRADRPPGAREHCARVGTAVRAEHRGHGRGHGPER